MGDSFDSTRSPTFNGKDGIEDVGIEDGWGVPIGAMLGAGFDFRLLFDPVRQANQERVLQVHPFQSGIFIVVADHR